MVHFAEGNPQPLCLEATVIPGYPCPRVLFEVINKGNSTDKGNPRYWACLLQRPRQDTETKGAREHEEYLQEGKKTDIGDACQRGNAVTYPAQGDHIDNQGRGLSRSGKASHHVRLACTPKGNYDETGGGQHHRRPEDGREYLQDRFDKPPVGIRRGVRDIPDKRDQPESKEEESQPVHLEQVDAVLQKTGPVEEEERGHRDGEEQRISVAEPYEKDEHSVHNQVSAVTDPPVQRPREEDGERHADTVGELPGKRAGYIPPPHGIRLHKEEKEGEDRAGGGNGKSLVHEAKRRVAAQGEGKNPQDGDQFEGDLKRDHLREEGHQYKGEGEVELEKREPGVISHRPAGDPSLRQEYVAHILGRGVVRARVPARCCRQGKEIFRSEITKQEDED